MKNIALIFGGCSPEYGVSLQSAYAVITHIDRLKYNPVLIGISRDGSWFLFRGSVEKIPDDTWCKPDDCTPVTVVLSKAEHNLLLLKDDKVEEIHIDAAFPILHGRNGEDGTVQGLLELLDIPIIGCGVLASALCMDKDRAHKLVQAVGISVPKSFILTKSAYTKGIDIKAADTKRADAKDTNTQAALDMAEQLGYPLFVKPVKAGSSYGVTKVSDRNALPAAIERAFEYDEEIIVEEYISGFEVGCAVLGKETLTLGKVDEIELADGFFDYTEKYTLKTSAIHVPARVDEETAKRISKAAETIYRTLGCSGFARVDMFLSDSGEIVFNEVNTIPGFTTHSRFPSMMKAAGISFEQIISMAIEEALEA